MAQKSDEIIGILKRYINELDKSNLHIKKAILFGSYAKGNYQDWSDIDIALVSDDFQGIRFLDKQKISDITFKIDDRIDPVPFKTDDFSEDDIFIKEIINTGIVIK